MVHSADEISRTHIVDTPLDGYAPAFLRGGSVVHMQDPTNVKTTLDLDNNFTMLIAYKPSATDPDIWIANGTIMDIKSYDDDTIISECIKKNCLEKLNY